MIIANYIIFDGVVRGEDTQNHTFGKVANTTAHTTPTYALVASQVVEFCICARINGAEYWDNNGASNYRIRFEKLSI